MQLQHMYINFGYRVLAIGLVIATSLQFHEVQGVAGDVMETWSYTDSVAYGTDAIERM